MSHPTVRLVVACCVVVLLLLALRTSFDLGEPNFVVALRDQVDGHSVRNSVVNSGIDASVSSRLATPLSSVSTSSSLGWCSMVGMASVLVGAVRARSRRLKASRCLHQTPIRGVVSCRAGDAVPILRLGTRGSPLALAQAFETKRRLAEAFPELAGKDAVHIQVIQTTGDQRLDIPLAEIGGKGLFTKELDIALLNKEVDFCVHSTKDVPTQLAPGTELCTMLPREDTRDVLISGDPNIQRIEDFAPGSLIGTASLRRQAQIYAKNPHVKCVNFRGNVQTRLRKLKAGEVKGTFLAYAGLKRMNMEENVTRIMEWDEMLPAIAQGAISFQCRSGDERVLKYLKPLSHELTFQAVTCERAFLAILDGSCKTPIAGQAVVNGGKLRFIGLVSSIDGQRVFRVERHGDAADAAQIGRDAGLAIRKEAGEKFFEDMQLQVKDLDAANSKPITS